MKRKDFENAYDDEFSCFSLAASARKSRRLDCELAPIIEEEPGSEIPMVPDQGFLNGSSYAEVDLVPSESHSVSPVIVGNEPPSQELSIVLYNPENAASHGMVKYPGSSNFSIVMNPELLSGWKSQMLHQGNQTRLTITELDEESEEYKSFQSKNSMAVVPWVASQKQPYVTAPDAEEPDMNLEPMEADADCEMMEFDDNSSSSAPGFSTQDHTTNDGAQTVSSLQPPHCFIPQQYAPNTFTPIPW